MALRKLLKRDIIADKASLDKAGLDKASLASSAVRPNVRQTSLSGKSVFGIFAPLGQVLASIRLILQRWPSVDISTRMTGRVMLGFLMMQIVIVPIYLNNLRQNNLHVLVQKAALARALFANIDDLRTAERSALYLNHNLRGVIEKTPSGAEKIFWFVNQNREFDRDKIIDIDNDGFFRGIAHLLHLLLLKDSEHNAVAKGTDIASGKTVHVIYAEGIIADILRKTFNDLLFWSLLLSLPLAFFSRRGLGRDLQLSIGQFVHHIYGKDALAGGKGGKAGGPMKAGELQARLKAHIHEQTRLASLGAGASRLAHDLRNVLASLQLYGERLSLSKTEREKRMGERMLISVERAVGLCDWTMRYACDIKQNVDRHKQELSPLLDEVAALVRLHDVSQRVKLVHHVPPHIEVDCERTLAFRIIYNIVLNAIQAIQATDKGSRVDIFARREANQCFITIKDDGPGMDDKTVEKLFVPYQGSLRPGGSGLGMAIADELSRWHGGHIELVRTGAEGSEFLVCLPDSPQTQTTHPDMTTDSAAA